MWPRAAVSVREMWCEERVDAGRGAVRCKTRRVAREMIRAVPKLQQCRTFHHRPFLSSKRAENDIALGGAVRISLAVAVILSSKLFFGRYAARFWYSPELIMPPRSTAARRAAAKDEEGTGRQHSLMALLLCPYCWIVEGAKNPVGALMLVIAVASVWYFMSRADSGVKLPNATGTGGSL